MLHGQTSVDVESRHEVGLAGLRVLQALSDEGGAAFGEQQELFDVLRATNKHTGLMSFHQLNKVDILLAFTVPLC